MEKESDYLNDVDFIQWEKDFSTEFAKYIWFKGFSIEGHLSIELNQVKKYARELTDKKRLNFYQGYVINETYCTNVYFKSDTYALDKKLKGLILEKESVEKLMKQKNNTTDVVSLYNEHFNRNIPIGEKLIKEKVKHMYELILNSIDSFIESVESEIDFNEKVIHEHSIKIDFARNEISRISNKRQNESDVIEVIELKPKFTNSPFIEVEHFEAFCYLNENFNPKGKVRWTYIYNTLTDGYPLGVSQKRYFTFISDFFETVSDRKHGTANSRDLESNINKHLDNFKNHL